MANPDEIASEFSAKYKGGIWTARIDTQDEVAAIVALEALGGTLNLVPKEIASKQGRIAFEAREDFELRWLSARQYVSVKDRQVNRSDLLQALKNLQAFVREVGDEECQTIRIEAASLTPSARSFYEDIERLRTLRNATAREDYERSCRDFRREHDLSAMWAERLVVVERRIGSNPSFANAVFSHAMRQALPVHNYGDSDLVSLFRDLVKNIFRDKRLRRGVLDLSDLERMLLAPLTPQVLASYDIAMEGYVKTEFGYLPDRTLRAEMLHEQRLVTAFARKLMKEWRRKTFWKRVIAPPIKCLSCNHPMIANWNGRRGIACPHCGYNPYATLFYACDCGNGAVLIRQPSISPYLLVRDIYRTLRAKDAHCIGCGKLPAPETLLRRVFMLRIPYPIEQYSDEQLIKWREKLGWGLQFKSPKDPKLTAEEALLRTVDPQALKEFPHDDLGV
jgi:hypothetical protein